MASLIYMRANPLDRSNVEKSCCNHHLHPLQLVAIVNWQGIKNRQEKPKQGRIYIFTSPPAAIRKTHWRLKSLRNWTNTGLMMMMLLTILSRWWGAAISPPRVYSACTVVLVVVLSQQPKSGPKQPLDKEQGQTVEKEVDVVHVLVRYQRLFILFLIWRGKIKKETTLFSKNFYLMFQHNLKV